ncbi:bi-domain-containing oxidoreductase [bacterium]|nr:bi-domain-containing oxidoreductase [bacterium]
MLQILQNLKTGETELADVPAPRVIPGHLLIQTSVSLISSGTERMLLEFGKANLINKARQQPDRVKMVLDKIKTDGLIPTIEAVRSKLDMPLPLGYCNSGTVLEVGKGVTGFSAGDRVASNGKHAEIVCVPKNLCAVVPGNVDDDAASFTVLGAIALQGIRLAQPTLGETFVVVGLGLVGQLAVQLLKAAGCRVLGLDYVTERTELARKAGAEVIDLSSGPDPVDVAISYSRGRGVDGVLITADTKSNEPVHQAALMCRKRGRIIMVGVTGLELSRADFYEKELSFQVSCSYGPGRYDPSYEEGGNDYPEGYVRWTEQRNFEAVLDMMAGGRMDVKPLISKHIPMNQAQDAYKIVEDGSALGLLLKYESGTSDRKLSRTIKLDSKPQKLTPGSPVVAFIGAGQFGARFLIPAVKSAGAVLQSVATGNDTTGYYAGKKFGFAETTTDAKTIFQNDTINTVFIATRHDSHAGYICKAIKTGKNVYTEKPLAITHQQLDMIESAYEEVAKKDQVPRLMVGFNRRFASQVVKMKSLLASLKEPKTMIYTINAGMIPSNNWIQDPEVGGGRIIGEGCHFIDLLRFIVDKPITSFNAMMIGDVPEVTQPDDKMTITLQFVDGSIGTIHYFANGDKTFPKERLEVFCASKILQLDNFRKLTGYGWKGFKSMTLRKQDKGINACSSAFIDAIKRGAPSPIPADQLFEETRINLKIMDSVRK